MSHYLKVNLKAIFQAKMFPIELPLPSVVVDSDDKSDGGAITIAFSEWHCSMCAAPPVARQRSTVARHLRVAHSLTVDAYDQARAEKMAQYERMKK